MDPVQLSSADMSSRPVVFWSALELYLSNNFNPATIKTYAGSIRRFCAFMRADYGSGGGYSRLMKATGSDIERYVMHQRQRSGRKSKRGGVSELLADSTISGNLTGLKTMFKWMVLRGYLDTSPFMRAQFRLKPYANQKRPTESVPFERVPDMFRAAEKWDTGPRDTAFLALSFGGALRRSEVWGVRIGDIRRTSAGAMFIALRDTKNGTDAKQPVADEMAQFIERYARLRRWQRASDADFLFAWADGTQISYHTLYHRFRKACEECGLDTNLYSPHAARATMCTKMYGDGATLNQLREFMRHANIQTTMRYIKEFTDVDDSPARDAKFFSESCKKPLSKKKSMI